MSLDVSEPALIGVDWGTSSLRAFLIGANGKVLDKVSSSEGIMHVPKRDFEGALRRLIGSWVDETKRPVLMSGMITSRNGWLETPYLSVPLGAGELARALVSHTTSNGIDLRFITGATTNHASGPDVMRGEETQIIGASALGMSEGTFVLPGTHSKWIRVSESQIEDYATYMTGEIFAALKCHTILGTLIEEGPFSSEGFSKGVEAGLADGSVLLHDLFHVRTLPLLGRMRPEDVEDYLSGLLIGAEIKAAQVRGDAGDTVTIVGRTDLADRYETALAIAGMDSQRAPDDIVAMGHFLIARSAGLVS